MFLELLLIGGGGAFLASGYPQKLYKKFEDNIGDVTFKAKSYYHNSKKVLGTSTPKSKLNFEIIKTEYTIDKLNKAIQTLQYLIVDIQQKDLDGKDEKIKDLNARLKYAKQKKEDCQFLLDELSNDIIEIESSEFLTSNGIKDIPDSLRNKERTKKEALEVNFTKIIDGDLYG